MGWWDHGCEDTSSQGQAGQTQTERDGAEDVGGEGGEGGRGVTEGGDGSFCQNFIDFSHHIRE